MGPGGVSPRALPPVFFLCFIHSFAPWPMTSDLEVVNVDPDLDCYSEEAIEELIGDTTAELAQLLSGATATLKQVLRELTRVLTEASDLLLLLGSDLLDIPGALVADLLSLAEYDLMNAPMLIS